jgi:hypothetical protein
MPEPGLELTAAHPALVRLGRICAVHLLSIEQGALGDLDKLVICIHGA